MSTKNEHAVEGKTYDLTPEEKAIQIRMSTSWLAKDRMKDEPEIDFVRRGRTVRYSAD